MRILQVVHALPPATYGGTELYTRDLAAALAERGHEVGVAAARGADAEIPGVETFALPDPRGETAPELGGRPLPAVVRRRTDEAFERLLADFDPDAVHCQHFKHLSASIPELCAEREISCVATLHDFWTICHREQLYRPEGRPCSGPESVGKCAECYRRAKAADTTVTDGGAVVAGSDDCAGVARRTAHLRRALAATDRLLAPSDFLRETFVEFGTPPDRIEQCRNGIEVDRFEDTGFDPDGPLRVGYAGRITERKGVHLPVEAVREVPDAELHVFGRFDPESDPYHARLAAAAGDRTTFHGWYADRPTPYREVDVLVLSSVWYENSPLVIQEAFASGVPAVTADAGGMAELVADGEDGLTFPIGDADALASALTRLADDPSLVADLRAGVEEPKRLADHAAEIEALYAEVRGVTPWGRF